MDKRRNENMKDKYELTQINDNIQSIIERFDNKASILTAVVGIVFGLSLNFLDLFNALKIESNNTKFILLIIFTSFYFVSFILTISFLLAVIYPRRKKTGAKNIIYYGDVANMTDEELEKNINEFSNNEENSFVKNQLKVNSDVCMKKHKFFVKAVWSLIPLFVFMVSLVIMTFII